MKYWYISEGSNQGCLENAETGVIVSPLNRERLAREAGYVCFADVPVEEDGSYIL